MNFLKPVSSSIENTLKIPIIFTLLVMYQVTLSRDIVYIPNRVVVLFNEQWFRVLSIFILALSVTSDIEIALLSMIIFIATLYVLKTPEERKKTGFI
jgi:hypothetical protein|tara:strand:+ start:95 stop:385 length:291 start_codon:yes stop_codon:yes gene_type:complete